MSEGWEEEEGKEGRGSTHPSRLTHNQEDSLQRYRARENTAVSLSLSLSLSSRILTFQSPRSENNKRTVILVEAAIFESCECVSAITDDQIRRRAQVAVSLEYTITSYLREKPQQREGRENAYTRLHRWTCLIHLIESS